jgi:hypothetical protein
MAYFAKREYIMPKKEQRSDAGKTDGEIAELHGVTPLTVARTRQRWVEEHSLDDASLPGDALYWWMDIQMNSVLPSIG